MIIGFFMILVDSTIVTIAMPHIMGSLQTGLNQVIWVTSAYLLAYAVPLLITGRLGDRFGPKPVFLAGLLVFTASSLWCGLSGSIEMLILARVVQGFGAALMAPQTMAVIMRTFPPERRGAPMGIWGSVAGLAMLVGPLLGGFLVDALGWEWIFFINVPVGVAAMVLVSIHVARLETHSHSFDWVGVTLSAVGLFLIVFGIQEGETFHWGSMPATLGSVQVDVPIWAMIAAGTALMVVFVWWQQRTTSEPLVPLELFRDRNYVMSNVAIALMGLVTAGVNIPLFLYVQSARGLTPSQSALLMLPMAVTSGVLAPLVGRFLQTRDARGWVAAGLLGLAASVAWYGLWMDPSRSPWWLLLPSATLGASSSLIWGPLALIATRNLPRDLSGAGSGVYNTTRQVGAVIGSAAMAAMMSARLAVELGPDADINTGSAGGVLPPQFIDGFSTAMGQSMFLPASLLLLAVFSVGFMRAPHATPDPRPH